MDKIRLEGIQLACIIGTDDWERQLKQKLLLDLVLELDLSVAGQSDRLEDTIDYVAVVNAVTDLARDSQYLMIEALAEAIAQRLLEEPPVDAVSVVLNKGASVKGAKNVAVTIRRSKVS
ncbi:MAG: dihydroneopterin aldolase [Proteobacteria bacterium]|nr:dihydroneopterin aldolase [Pseudomonadota bacterium]